MRVDMAPNVEEAEQNDDKNSNQRGLDIWHQQLEVETLAYRIRVKKVREC